MALDTAFDPFGDLIYGEAYAPLYENVYYEHYGFHGGRGGAKSHAVAEALVKWSHEGYERVVCGRQFQISIKDSVKELIESKIRKFGLQAYFKTTNNEIEHLITGSRFTFVGMDRNPESVKSLEGATVFWGEEAQTFTKRSIELIVPTVRSAGSRLIWTWNPRFRTDEIDVQLRGPVPPENSLVVHVGKEDNPFWYRTRLESERRRSRRANPKRYAHIWEGAYDENPDAAVFTNWRCDRIDVPDKIAPRFGLDFGFSSDPNALVKVYVIEPWDLGREDDELGIIYVAQESVGYHVANRNLPTLMEQVTEVRNYSITADSARPETIEELQNQGFSVYGAKKGAGSVKNGINFMQGYEIVVSPDCPTTLNEVQHYQWMLDANDKPLPKPAEDQQDHCLDGIRYAVEDLSRTGPAGDGVDYV